jgi:hypothetical protein
MAPQTPPARALSLSTVEYRTVPDVDHCFRPTVAASAIPG